MLYVTLLPSKILTSNSVPQSCSCTAYCFHSLNCSIWLLHRITCLNVTRSNFTARFPDSNYILMSLFSLGTMKQKEAQWYLPMSYHYHISSDTHVLLSIKMQVTGSLQTWLICDTVITVQSHPPPQLLHTQSVMPHATTLHQTMLISDTVNVWDTQHTFC
jgi:hypothetical protein